MFCSHLPSDLSFFLLFTFRFSPRREKKEKEPTTITPRQAGKGGSILPQVRGEREDNPFHSLMLLCSSLLKVSIVIVLLYYYEHYTTCLTEVYSSPISWNQLSTFHITLVQPFIASWLLHFPEHCQAVFSANTYIHHPESVCSRSPIQSALLLVQPLENLSLLTILSAWRNPVGSFPLSHSQSLILWDALRDLFLPPFAHASWDIEKASSKTTVNGLSCSHTYTSIINGSAPSFRLWATLVMSVCINFHTVIPLSLRHFVRTLHHPKQQHAFSARFHQRVYVCCLLCFCSPILLLLGLLAILPPSCLHASAPLYCDFDTALLIRSFTHLHPIIFLFSHSLFPFLSAIFTCFSRFRKDLHKNQ